MTGKMSICGVLMMSAGVLAAPTICPQLACGG